MHRPAMLLPLAAGDLDLCFWENRRDLGMEYTCEHKIVVIIFRFCLHLLCIALIAETGHY